jgi:hypothetical protein
MPDRLNRSPQGGLTIAGDELHGLELCLFRHTV